MHCSRVDAFRHRAAATITDPAGVSHGYLWLTLTRLAEEVTEFAARPVQSNGTSI
jgi:hypothetical protein